jgi:hypothetical protein
MAESNIVHSDRHEVYLIYYIKGEGVNKNIVIEKAFTNKDVALVFLKDINANLRTSQKRRIKTISCN